MSTSTPTTRLSAESFLGLIGQSRLIDPEPLRKALKDLKDAGIDVSDAKAVADEFVARNILTRWQAEKLLQGKHKGFFLGKYRLLSLLGTGGMSSVYLAEHVLMRRRVAIKILPQQRVDDSSYLKRFHREAQAVAALDHRNIVRAYDVDVDGRNHFLVMEYVPGKNLQELVTQEGTLAPVRAAEYMRQAAEGLAHAHKAGLVHRDIKPGNLLIDERGTIKLLDLGLARFFDEGDESSLTIRHDEKVLGTADYLSPEQARDSHNVDIRSDIYSLGCTLYFTLTGHPPFPDGTMAMRLLAHQQKEPAPIASKRSDIPESLIAICQKMMGKEVETRYQTARENAQALQEWLVQNGGAEWSAMNPVFAGASTIVSSPRSDLPGPGSSGSMPVVSAAASSNVLGPSAVGEPGPEAAVIGSGDREVAAFFANLADRVDSESPRAKPPTREKPNHVPPPPAAKSAPAKPAPPAATKSAPSAATKPASSVKSQSAPTTITPPGAKPGSDVKPRSDIQPKSNVKPRSDVKLKSEGKPKSDIKPKPPVQEPPPTATPPAEEQLPDFFGNLETAPTTQTPPPAEAPTLVLPPSEAVQLPDFSTLAEPSRQSTPVTPPVTAKPPPVAPVARPLPVARPVTPAVPARMTEAAPTADSSATAPPSRFDLGQLTKSKPALIAAAVVGGLVLMGVVWAVVGGFSSNRSKPPKDPKPPVTRTKATDAGPKAPLVQTLEVGPGKTYSTIAAALKRAKEYYNSTHYARTTIKVAPGSYPERIEIGPEYQGNGIEVVSADPASPIILNPSGSEPVIVLKDEYRNFLLENVVVDAKDHGIAIRITGGIENARFRNVKILGFTTAGVSCEGAYPLTKPTVFDGCEFRPGAATAVGIRFDPSGGTDSVRLNVLNCRFIGPMAAGIEFGSALEVNIANTIFFNLPIGVRFAGSEKTWRTIKFSHNTFFGGERGIVFDDMPAGGSTELGFYNNLFVEQTGTGVIVARNMNYDAFLRMFATGPGSGVWNNWTDATLPMPAAPDAVRIFEAGGGRAGFAEAVFLSKNPDDPDFLVPMNGSPLGNQEAVDGFGRFVGARAPK